MAGFQRGDDAGEFRRRAILLVGPQPVAAVEVEAVLERRRVVPRALRETEIEIDHLLKHAVVGRLIGEPHIVRVVVVREIEPSRLCGPRHRERAGGEAEDEGKALHG